MKHALGWNPAAPAAALRRVQAQLLQPGALAWFERLVPGGGDPWARFEALILAAMPGTSASTRGAPPAASSRPYSPRHDWPAPLPAHTNPRQPQAASATPTATAFPTPRPTASAGPSFDAPLSPLRAARIGAFLEPVSAPSVLAAAAGAPALPRATAALPAAATAASSPRAHGLPARADATPTPTSTSTRALPAAPATAMRSALPARSGAPTKPAAAQPSARVIGWPLARQQPAGSEIPTEARRTRIVEGLPALRSLMQSAVAQDQSPDTGPTSNTLPALAPVATPTATLPAPPAEHAASSMPRPAATSDPLADDVLVDRVIDRLDERLRELSLRHLGFTGGLGT